MSHAVLAEAFIKDVTSGDTMTARFMRGEFFEFKPVLKLWLGTNHKPIVRGTDEAIWDRICLIPFTVRIPEAERVPRREMMARLRAERAGILAWAVQGCLEWQQVGLKMPDQVRGATAGYRAEMDVIADFLADRCVIQKSAMVKVAELYSAYSGWCETSGERAITQRALGMRLIERGFTQKRHGAGGKWHWIGLGLATADDQEEGEL